MNQIKHSRWDASTQLLHNIAELGAGNQAIVPLTDYLLTDEHMTYLHKQSILYFDKCAPKQEKDACVQRSCF